MSYPIQVLVAEDSATLRFYIRTALESDPALCVVGEARNGQEAIDLCKKYNPDIITMDIHMPIMNGFDAIEIIMAEMPRPIIVLTTTESDLRMGTSLKAIEAGALMVTGKPRGMPGRDEDVDNLVAQVKAMAGVKVVGRRRRIGEKKEPVSPPRRFLPGMTETSIQLITIGTSTGGPAALYDILSQLPGDLPVPVVVVQHLSKGFITGLARWLDDNVSLRVKVAENGEILSPGTVYIAPDDRHLTVGRGPRAWLLDSPAVDRHRPSVTTLLASVAENFGDSAIGVILTGMGKDGAIGLKAIRDAGGYTFVQDESTSIVFGMPREAIAASAASEVLAVEKIAPRLLMKLARRKAQ